MKGELKTIPGVNSPVVDLGDGTFAKDGPRTQLRLAVVTDWNNGPWDGRKQECRVMTNRELTLDEQRLLFGTIARNFNNTYTYTNYGTD